MNFSLKTGLKTSLEQYIKIEEITKLHKRRRFRGEKNSHFEDFKSS